MCVAGSVQCAAGGECQQTQKSAQRVSRTDLERVGLHDYTPATGCNSSTCASRAESVVTLKEIEVAHQTILEKALSN
jgi:hypothetical protein